MKRILILTGNLTFILLLLSGMKHVTAQTDKLYDVEANPFEQFEKAKQEAKTEGKYIMLQIGGNWCKWCIKFHDFYAKDEELDSIIHTNYIIINVAYEPNKNQDFFALLGYPQRFGFPVFVITDAGGNRLHTQNSWYLEDGVSSYDKEKVKSFLIDWSVRSTNPDTYKTTE